MRTSAQKGISRRQLLHVMGGAAAGSRLALARELNADVAVVGGVVGGSAAALAAARNGMRVILTEETNWVRQTRMGLH
jgi:NADPH-dependent 2,4-dienoyl-CoA reductase/sulfur reductase-like enzyme